MLSLLLLKKITDPCTFLVAFPVISSHVFCNGDTFEFKSLHSCTRQKEKFEDTSRQEYQKSRNRMTTSKCAGYSTFLILKNVLLSYKRSYRWPSGYGHCTQDYCFDSYTSCALWFWVTPCISGCTKTKVVFYYFYRVWWINTSSLEKNG